MTTKLGHERVRQIAAGAGASDVEAQELAVELAVELAELRVRLQRQRMSANHREDLQRFVDAPAATVRYPYPYTAHAIGEVLRAQEDLDRPLDPSAPCSAEAALHALHGIGR